LGKLQRGCLTALPSTPPEKPLRHIPTLGVDDLRAVIEPSAQRLSWPCPATGQTLSLVQHVFRAAEHAIHCEDGAATMIARPLERIVRSQLHRQSPIRQDVPRAASNNRALIYPTDPGFWSGERVRFEAGRLMPM
jgi:hypothetical protein